MSERVELPVEGSRGVVAWAKGVKCVMLDGKDPGADVKIIRTRTENGVKVESGWLTFRLEPRIRVIEFGGGVTREVQTFRCWKPCGQECELMVCHNCGDLCWGDALDVIDASKLGCRCCGAGLATPGCITPHTFGSCFKCPDDGGGTLPMFVPMGASAEDRRSPQTGPLQSSDGLAKTSAVDVVR